MDPTAAKSLSAFLDRVEQPRRESLTELFPLIYDDLRKVAQRYMAAEKSDHTLQPTELVNEAFVRVRSGGAMINDQHHALALAAIAMRHILVDHARRRMSLKRGGGAREFALSGEEAGASREVEILELDDLIKRLGELDPRRARVVELRFFAGMTNEEIASAIGISRSTVVEDWKVASAWLRSQLRGGMDSRPDKQAGDREGNDGGDEKSKEGGKLGGERSGRQGAGREDGDVGQGEDR